MIREMRMREGRAGFFPGRRDKLQSCVQVPVGDFSASAAIEYVSTEAAGDWPIYGSTGLSMVFAPFHQVFQVQEGDGMYLQPSLRALDPGATVGPKNDARASLPAYYRGA